MLLRLQLQPSDFGHGERAEHRGSVAAAVAVVQGWFCSFQTCPMWTWRETLKLACQKSGAEGGVPAEAKHCVCVWPLRLVPCLPLPLA